MSWRELKVKMGLIKFLVIGKVHGQCCDYGWGTRGNTDYQIFKAKSMEEVKKKILDDAKFSKLIGFRNQPRGELLVVYAVSEEFVFDLKALQDQDAIEYQAYQEKLQCERDERELKRLQDKLKK